MVCHRWVWITIHKNQMRKLCIYSSIILSITNVIGTVTGFNPGPSNEKLITLWSVSWSECHFSVNSQLWPQCLEVFTFSSMSSFLLTAVIRLSTNPAGFSLNRNKKEMWTILACWWPGFMIDLERKITP